MTCALGYEPLAGEDAAERIWLAGPGSHRVATSCKDELLAALHELKPRKGARLVLLGAEVAALPEAERVALQQRIGFVPASGGLQSSLNAWENISLPVAFHAPGRLAALPAQVQALLEDIGGIDDDVLAKLPEEMTLYEKRVAAYVRALLEEPELLVVENLGAGLGPTKRRRTARFAEVYHARCPGGTYVQLEEWGASHER
jgi:ABC-type transporter Mla maintaining outer membrane lipid asymmetry ATPase subunit MlaF